MARYLVMNLPRLLKKVGFKLNEWTFNSSLVMGVISEDNHAYNLSDM